MILPAPVFELLENEGPLTLKVSSPASPTLLTPDETLPKASSQVIIEWILAHEAAQKAIREWLDFLRRTRARYTEVAEKMGRWNEQSSHSLGHDKWDVGWGGIALIPHANAIYALKSYGVSGRVLECGAFKGSSTACLSLTCAELGYQLDCADSFEGLPGHEGHYSQGDFLGDLEDVRANVSRYGNIDCVRFIQGWYADSLRNYADPISLLWLDVDLQESTLDVLRNVLPHVVRGGIILSDGFTEGVDFEGRKIAHTGGEPAGFYRYFQEKSLQYCAAPAGSKGLAQIALLPGETQRNFLLPGSLLHDLLDQL